MSSRRTSSANSRSESSINGKSASMLKEQNIQVYLNHRTRRPGGYDLNSSKINTSTYTVKRPDSSFVSNKISVNSNSSINSSDISSPSSKPTSMHKSILLMTNNQPRPVNVLQTLYSPTKPEESKYQCVPTPSQTVIVKSPKKTISEINSSINESEYFYSPTKTQCEIRNMISSKSEIPQPGNSFVSYITQSNNRVTKSRSKLANESNVKSTRSPSKAHKPFRKSSATSNTHSISVYADSKNTQNYSAIPSGSPVHNHHFDLMQNSSIVSENSSDVSPIPKKTLDNRGPSFTNSILTPKNLLRFVSKL
ncbi:hypothetical protein TVAGG3_0850640 [Trichomonas vaginalis G3]|uniref:hypothetical protein n=1 Tax=Trichomonas vaginalis (strain ATCC PRA-98 / G3) TaxID=412133 RepID=UPI0021E5DEC6|nr:hypothetical protein TVAGG3_0850640 [Trichomonas vaginalis G3]KAI5499958.1 hypothetical protein TVAGG3_0850640 [Trichomonas vaginalis G3]